MSEEILTLGNGLKFSIRIPYESGDERYIKEKLLSGEEYTPHGFELAEEDVVIDIGAHIGRFALYAGSEAQKGFVYAFEPQPENFAQFRKNLSLNNLPNVNLSSDAIADSSKKIFLHTNVDSARSSLYGNSDTKVEVNCIPLAQVFDKHSITRCSFLKLDCEGAEYEILFALPENYFSKIDKIVLEYHDHLSPKRKLPDMIQLLSRQGFIISIRPGAFYTGLLFAGKTIHSQPLLLLLNFLRVFWDLMIFTFVLASRRISSAFKIS